MAAESVKLQHKEVTLMIVAALALAAAFFPNPVHLHPHVRPADTRIGIALYNSASTFRDVKIDGRTYTVLQHQTLTIKAPAGTVVYNDRNTFGHHRGDVLLEVTPDLNNHRITLD